MTIRQLTMLSALFAAVCFLLLNGAAHGQTLYPTSAGGVGAVYTMSNRPTANQVLVHRLSASGQLALVGTVGTNGTGSDRKSTRLNSSHVD